MRKNLYFPSKILYEYIYIFFIKHSPSTIKINSTCSCVKIFEGLRLLLNVLRRTSSVLRSSMLTEAVRYLTWQESYRTIKITKQHLHYIFFVGANLHLNTFCMMCRTEVARLAWAWLEKATLFLNWAVYRRILSSGTTVLRGSIP